MDRPVQAAVTAETISLEPFQQSAALSLGVELELQLVNTHDYDLAPYSDEMLRLMARYELPGLGGAGDDVQHDRDLDRRVRIVRAGAVGAL